MSKDDKSSRPDDTRRAVKTTIVGGQPPGNSRDLEDVPVGLEQLLALAGANDEFKQALLADRERTVEAAGVVLTPTERAVLGATSEVVLVKMIAQVGTALPRPERRAFFQEAAVALGVLVAGGVLGGCKDKKGTASSESPKAPAPPPRPMQDMRADRARPVEPVGSRPDPPRPKPPKAGISPKKPKRIPDPEQFERAMAPRPRPKRKRPRRIIYSRGINPRRRHRILHPVTGIRPRTPMGLRAPPDFGRRRDDDK